MSVIVREDRPITPSSRGRIRVTNTDLSKGSRPHPSLTSSKKRISGRNNQGRMTVRSRGGGHKRLYRLIDFKRNKDGVPARVEKLEYDPNRTANIALLLYADGERRYIIAPKNVKVGDTLVSGDNATIQPGNAMPLSAVPLGSAVHCIEMRPGKGAQMMRSAGTSAQLIAKDGAYVTVRLKSGEMRKVLAACRATLGEVGNSEHNLRVLGSAGAARRRGRRPHVRGVAMNPVVQPHGGGEGKTSAGRHPVSFSCVPTKGYKTRKKRKSSSKYIVRDRRN